MIEFDESANVSAMPIGVDCGFTKRERACIDLLYPDSGLPWLNEMIQSYIDRGIGAQDYMFGKVRAMLKEGGGE